MVLVAALSICMHTIGVVLLSRSARLLHQNRCYYYQFKYQIKLFVVRARAHEQIVVSQLRHGCFAMIHGDILNYVLLLLNVHNLAEYIRM